MHNPSVAVIIVNYKGYELTRECLYSFSRVIYDDYALIVVDNGSCDHSVARLRAEFPQAVYIESERNLGFTGGNNLGLAAAYERGCRYVFFLNNDTVVSDNIFELVTFLEAHPEVGMASPLTFYHDNPERISFGGGYLDRNTGIITFSHKGDRRSDFTEKVIFCTFLEGAAIMARADLVGRAGGFNDDYFLNSEEAELCIKITDMGYRLAVIDNCFVWHKISQTMKPGSEMINYFVYRNRLHFVRNNALQLGVKQVFAIIYTYLRIILSFLSRGNYPAARGLLLGVIDYFRGVKGVGRFYHQLQQKSMQGD
jgi:GT2 family glycosyltransferase